MRWVIAFVTLVGVIVGAALAVGEWVVRPAAERAVAEDLRATYDLRRAPEVRLEAFPFLLAAARGRVDRAEVVGEGLVVEGLSIAEARIDADDIRFDPASLLAGEPSGTAGSVALTVTVTDEAFSDYLTAQGVPFAVAVDGGGRAEISGTVTVGGIAATGSAAGRLAVTDGVASFRPDRVLVAGVDLPSGLTPLTEAAFAFDVAIPEITGVRVTEVDLSTAGAVTLRADVTAYVLSGRATARGR